MREQFCFLLLLVAAAATFLALRRKLGSVGGSVWWVGGGYTQDMEKKTDFSVQHPTNKVNKKNFAYLHLPAAVATSFPDQTFPNVSTTTPPNNCQGSRGWRRHWKKEEEQVPPPLMAIWTQVPTLLMAIWTQVPPLLMTIQT